MAQPLLIPHPENATIDELKQVSRVGTDDQQALALAQLIDQSQQAQRSFWTAKAFDGHISEEKSYQSVWIRPFWTLSTVLRRPNKLPL